jgi:hypothetical protein
MWRITCQREIGRMPQLTVDVPDEIAERLARVAAEQNKSVEQLVVERLASVP